MVRFNLPTASHGQWGQFQVMDAGNGVALLLIKVEPGLGHGLQSFDRLTDLIDLFVH